MANEDRILKELNEAPELQGALKIEELLQNEGWKFLADKFSGFKKAVADDLGKRLMAGQPIEREAIYYQRGYARAVQDIFNAPKRVLQEFELAAERALEREEQRLSEEDDEVPYT